jgi:2-methylcitrate dehydratase
MPVRYTTQLPVWVAFELRKEVQFHDIESICVDAVRRYVISPDDYPEYWNPLTRETADHSAPYLIAAALVDGEISAQTFTAARFRDPTILALTQKIRFELDEEFSAAFPKVFNCRFRTTMKSGEVITVHQSNPKGHPDNPMSDREIEEKFLKQADAAQLPKTQSRALLDRLWELDKLDDIQKVFALMLVPDN